MRLRRERGREGSACHFQSGGIGPARPPPLPPSTALSPQTHTKVRESTPLARPSRLPTCAGCVFAMAVLGGRRDPLRRLPVSLHAPAPRRLQLIAVEVDCHAGLYGFVSVRRGKRERQRVRRVRVCAGSKRELVWSDEKAFPVVCSDAPSIPLFCVHAICLSVSDVRERACRRRSSTGGGHIEDRAVS